MDEEMVKIQKNIQDKIKATKENVPSKVIESESLKMLENKHVRRPSQMPLQSKSSKIFRPSSPTGSVKNQASFASLHTSIQ
jgi:hypothetical protein